MQKAIKALILQRRIQSGGNKYLILFSEEMGKVEAIARAAAKPSRWSGRFEPLTLLSLTLYGARSPYKITSAEFLGDFPSLTSSPEALKKVAPFIHLLTRNFPMQDPYPEIFHLLLEILCILPDCSELDSLYSYFNYRCLFALGGIPPEPALSEATLKEICGGKMLLLNSPAFHTRLRSAWRTSLDLDFSF